MAQLLMTEIADPWGLPWPQEAGAPAAWLVPGTDTPELLPVFCGPDEGRGLLPLTQQQLRDLNDQVQTLVQRLPPDRFRSVGLSLDPEYLVA